MSQSGSFLPDHIPGLDMQTALGRLRGNQKLYAKLLIQMREELPKMQEKITEALSTGNFQDLSMHAHTVKGMAGNLGADLLQDASAALEAAVKQGEIDKIFTRMEQYEKTARELGQALAGLQPPV